MKTVWRVVSLKNLSPFLSPTVINSAVSFSHYGLIPGGMNVTFPGVTVNDPEGRNTWPAFSSTATRRPTL
jgi:hypothetical protein